MKKVIFLLCFLSLFAGEVCAFNVTLSAKIEGGEKPHITGVTNLPDGIVLMITITRPESQYVAQDKVTVKGGAFHSVVFSQKEGALNSGRYSIDIFMPIASVQPPSTWPVIGNEGENLEGPFVKNNPFGGKIVQYKTSMLVGSGQGSSEKDRMAREEAQRDAHEARFSNCSDICKFTQVIARDRGEAFNLDRCYYNCVADKPMRK